MHPSRCQFQVRTARERDIGDKLVWRFPLASPEGRAALEPALAEERRAALEAGEPVPRDPESITVGYYIHLDDPGGAWAFMPVNTARALAVLRLPTVLRRIADDLVARIAHAS